MAIFCVATWRALAPSSTGTDEGPNLDIGNCDEVGEDRTLLGGDQERWLHDGLSEGGVTWNLIGNPIVLAGIDTGIDSPVHYLETWDGYPEARKRMIDSIAGATNPVVLTGDYHAGMVLDLHEVPFDETSAVVAPELMSPPISSVLFDADVSARTPHLREQTNAHGYLTVEVTPERLTARFRVLEDVTDPDSTISTSSARVGHAPTQAGLSPSSSRGRHMSHLVTMRRSGWNAGTEYGQFQVQYWQPMHSSAWWATCTTPAWRCPPNSSPTSPCSTRSAVECDP